MRQEPSAGRKGDQGSSGSRFAQGIVEEGLRPAGSQGGESSGDVAGASAGEEILAKAKGSQETGIEAVADAEGINRRNRKWSDLGGDSGVVDQGSAWPALDDDGRDPGSEGIKRARDVRRAGDAKNLGLTTRREDIDEGKEIEQRRRPAVIRVVVGVERDRQAGALEVLKNLGEGRGEGPPEARGRTDESGDRPRETAGRGRRRSCPRWYRGTSGCGAPRGVRKQDGDAG